MNTQSTPGVGPALEDHLSVQQIAKAWSLSVDAVRVIFEHESGVLRIDRPETLHKRKYTTLRIPLSVMQRVHRRLSIQ